MAKSHRTVARLTARSVVKGSGWGGLADDAALTVTITFQPPDNRRRDTDNMLASCKAYLDGVADALGVDDSRWTLRIERLPGKAPGAVSITIEV